MEGTSMRHEDRPPMSTNPAQTEPEPAQELLRRRTRMRGMGDASADDTAAGLSNGVGEQRMRTWPTSYL
jgi:hypothetical protein